MFGRLRHRLLICNCGGSGNGHSRRSGLALGLGRVPCLHGTIQAGAPQLGHKLLKPDGETLSVIPEKKNNFYHLYTYLKGRNSLKTCSIDQIYAVYL